MSRYDDLATHASKFLLTLNQLESTCQNIAWSLMRRYMQYLECPQDKLLCVQLNRDLEYVGNEEQFNPSLDLIQAPDGFWYFAYRLTINPPGTLEWVQETVCLGVNFVDGIPMVRHGERTFELREPRDEESFFGYLFDGTCGWLSATPKGRQRTIGYQG